MFEHNHAEISLVEIRQVVAQGALRLVDISSTRMGNRLDRLYAAWLDSHSRPQIKPRDARPLQNLLWSPNSRVQIRESGGGSCDILHLARGFPWQLPLFW